MTALLIILAVAVLILLGTCAWLIWKVRDLNSWLNDIDQKKWAATNAERIAIEQADAWIYRGGRQ